METVRKSTCRSCGAFCPVDVTIDDGRVVKVEGDPDAPIYKAFICPKGRALAEAHNDRNRLKHSLKRMPDGSYTPISSAQLVEEISEKIRDIVARHGPRAVAGYLGNATTEQQAAGAIMFSFLVGLGSDWFFSNGTIDQPGMMMADALHGSWAGGRSNPLNCDVFMMVGGNPVISKQYFGQNPGQQLKQMISNGTKLIVIDPRRTETARRARVHLQCIPGEDPTIIAGLIHLVIANGQVNEEFVKLNAAGLDNITRAVSRFTPEYVSTRAGVSEADLREAARIIGESRTGDFGSGVGPAMATRGTLTAYLMRCLQTLRGFWAAEGDEAIHASVLMPARPFKAQPTDPKPAWGYGRDTRVRGLQLTAAGMPVAALPEEILTPGEGQIRALFVQSNPAMAWPQTELSRKALESLELLITHDVEISPISRMAHYVIATHKVFEVPCTTQFIELVGMMHPGYGWDEPYAAYTPAILEPPGDADLMESWQIFYRVAQKLGMDLKCSGFFDNPATAPSLDMTREPTTDELYELLCQNAAVPLAEVKKYPSGHVFDSARVFVGPRDGDCTTRLDLANATMMEELNTVATESYMERRKTSAEFPFLFICRRIQNTTNASYLPSQDLLKTSYNPAYMHSDTLRQLNIQPGDRVEIRSRHGAIISFSAVDDDMRPGVVAMTHGFGKTSAQEDYDPRRDGANVNELLHWLDDYDPYHGMPRMSAVPIAVKAIPEAAMSLAS